MTSTENARQARAGAVLSADGPRAQHNRTTDKTQHQPGPDKLDPLIKPVSTDKDNEALAGPRFERLIERVHLLGPRALAELLAEIATATGEPALIARHLEEFARLDPAILHFLGADRFPPNVLGMVR